MNGMIYIMTVHPQPLNQSSETITFKRQLRFLLFLLLFIYSNGALIWSDEFNEENLDESKWTIYTGNTNKQLQKYTDRKVNVFVENGNLVLQALKENFAGYNYTSGRIHTRNKADFLYCTVKVRAKLPFGRGLWPAIWMLPTYYLHGPGIASGEMDIMELLGQQPNKIHSTVHYGNSSTDRGKKTNSYILPHGNFSDDFHEFIIDWAQSQIDFYVDNIKIMTFSPSDVPRNYSYPFDDYFYVILNVAVGGNWPLPPDNTTEFPQRMEVDYVRVYNEL